MKYVVYGAGAVGGVIGGLMHGVPTPANEAIVATTRALTSGRNDTGPATPRG